MIHVSYYVIIVPLSGGMPWVKPAIPLRLYTDGNITDGAPPSERIVCPFGQMTNLTNCIKISYLLKIHINNL